LIYTSGSKSEFPDVFPKVSDFGRLQFRTATGTPKGICIPHVSALTFLLSESTVLGITEHDTVWQGFSPAFDMWIEETWISFCQGAHVVIGTREECLDTSGLGALWRIRDVSVVHAVPTLMGIMAMDGSDDAGVPDNVRLIVSFIFHIALSRRLQCMSHLT
jgi:non-ribosomal peptide synthetase component F